MSEKQLNRIILSIEDVNQALAIAKIIVTEKYFNEPFSNKKDKTIARSLQCAMIVSYKRPFSGNGKTKTATSYPGVKLEEKLNESQWSTHQELSYLRDKFFAHTDSKPLGLVRNSSKPTNPLISSNPFKMKSEQSYFSYIDLFEKVLDILIQKSIELQDKLANEKG
ncbi:MAG: hypothetical protein VYD53_18155 [Pseudomonadota bacterium]|nr:hypothetical protein [Pseudomonadota bacterium]